MTNDDANPTCSFCGKTKKEAGCPVFVSETGAGICFECVKMAEAGEYPVAYCSACTVFEGEHQISCPQSKGCAWSNLRSSLWSCRSVW